MIAIIGFIVVLSSVVGGYLLAKGNLSVLFQPTEVLIIFGAAVGGFLISSPLKVAKKVSGSILRIFTRRSLSKDEYMDALLLLNGIFYKIRQQGLVSIESDIDEVETSPLFSAYPNIVKNERAINLITDTLRTVMTTTIAPHELEALLDSELEAHMDELIAPSKSVSFVADSLPGLGIVAAVLGIVITMGQIGDPPEVLGKHIGAALVGTFLGVLLCYGFVGPMGRNLEHEAAEKLQYLTVLKVSLLSFIGGAAPKMAVEFGRRVIPTDVRPTFAEVEEMFRQVKK